MSREQKIRKLCNAVKDFRGASVNGRYIRHPQNHAVIRVVTWLSRLGNSPKVIESKLALIAGFQTREEFDQWITKGGATP